jgi:hypothetical protein
MKLWENTDVDFDIIDQLLIKYTVVVRNWRKCGSIMGAVTQLFMDFEKAHNSED